MSRVIGFVLLAVLLVVLLLIFLRKKKQKSACAKVLDATEKGFDSYYKTNSASIVGDSTDEAICNAVTKAATATATSIVSSKYGKAAIAASPAGAIAGIDDIAHGNVGEGAQEIIGTLTGANAISELIGDNRTPAQLSCGELDIRCRTEKTQYRNPQNLAGKGRMCTELGSRCRTGTADHGDTAIATQGAANPAHVRGTTTTGSWGSST